MEVSAEAKRVMVVALGKLYSSRTQRGGLRLHRSLLLTLVMRSARDIYHAAQAAERPTDTGSVPREAPTKSAVDTERDTPPRPDTLQTRNLSQENHCDSQPLLGGSDRRGDREDKENRGPAGLHRHSRKRRGKAAAEPDFLPCKKAKMEGKGLQQLALNSVLRSSNCGGVVGACPSPVPMSCAIVAF